MLPRNENIVRVIYTHMVQVCRPLIDTYEA
jgi:hypothetical protein